MNDQGPAWLADAIALRRTLHANPELRMQEHATANHVADVLAGTGFTLNRGVAGTGIVASLDRGVGPHVVVRADMDALPLEDHKAVPYRSTNPGVAHACGHDVHMSVVATVGRLMAGDHSWRGRLTLLFQPAEEIPFGEASGAQAVIDAGAWPEDVDAVLAYHCWPDLEVGSIRVDHPVAMAAKRSFRITVMGKAAHVATPARGCDAVLVASKIVAALHTIPSRWVEPSEPLSLNVGTINGGTSQSILADSVAMTGTVRFVEERTGPNVEAAIEALSRETAKAHRAQVRVEWANHMPSVRNNEDLARRATHVLGGLSGVTVAPDNGRPSMTTDDFALYAERAPGLYLKLGVNGGAASGHSLHSSMFDVDERSLRVGVEAMVALVQDLLSAPIQSTDDGRSRDVHTQGHLS